MRVLVACEFSGVVRRAFRERGHDAWSCDLLPAEDHSPYHIQGDALELLDQNWDLMIGHPPCTYLCNSGVRWLKDNPERWERLRIAAWFFRQLLEAPISWVCIENPIPHRYAMEMIGRRNYDQVIQPYEFGHGETKATCLWLKGLPKLRRTSVDAPLFGATVETGRIARVHHEPPSPDRWKNRSRTYAGIAAAMAEQWGYLG